ncbi:integrase core domain-containing protein [Haliangium ochraceum]|uniref:Integrase catalytic domain-containing protein n=1 Tax=Haliangium ochraceum (strain DSM 14365 / JCM 11303 / SMP-2) TaxID=502025 RepID=D0LQW5_HALO1|nr:integrase core domain-containing protein [Haliangium ochraceum]ACY15473.1 hypothetical protein Hoch_2959 [Haliangium ochraceum DSM 14365]
MYPVYILWITISGWVYREQSKLIEYLQAENRALREQLGNRRPRFTDAQRRRLAVKGKALGRKLLREYACIVSPDTILRWYRDLIAKKYDGSAKRSPGRPQTASEIQALVVRMARENPGWGYTRIRDALGNLGHHIGRSTVAAILKAHGLDPAPIRSKRTSWKTFLRSHWQATAACDFFTVEALTPTGLDRFYVFFVIEFHTRRVEIAGIVRQPHGGWMLQIARNLLDADDGFLLGKRYLIMDRDPLYTTAFRELLTASGIKPIRLPPRSPNLNAYAERCVRSVKSECLDKLVLLGEHHLRSAVSEFAAHYHTECNHQGINSRIIQPISVSAQAGSIVARERLGGLLHFYHRAGAG